MIAVVWSSVRGQEREWSQTETMSDFCDGYHTVHCKKSEDQLPQESGSLVQAGPLKFIQCWPHVPHCRDNRITL